MDAISAAGMWVLVLLTDTRTGLMLQTTYFKSQDSCDVGKDTIMSLKNTSVLDVSCLETTNELEENPQALILYTDTIVGLLVKSVSSLSEAECHTLKTKILNFKHNSVNNVECINK